MQASNQENQPSNATLNPKMYTHHLGMRMLAELTNNSGGLSRQSFGGVTAVEGIRLHQEAEMILANDYPHGTLKPEVALGASYSCSPFCLELRGKADCVHLGETQTTIIEIKSFKGDIKTLPKQGNQTHLAQLKLYAFAWQQMKKDFAPIFLRLAYLNVDDPTLQKNYQFTVTAGELQSFFNDACQLYLKSVSNYLNWLKVRNLACQNAKFPYANVRSGQKQMMQTVLQAIKTKHTVMIEAPTGIGKTIASLYPALKALAAGYTERILYLTAMTSTRKIAEAAIADLTTSGFVMRSLTLTTKENLCQYPELFCDQELCPGAVSYYERLPLALEELIGYVKLDAPLILQIAQKYGLCPFELQLDAALYADVIIGDYNHLLDPKAAIKRLQTQESGNITALFDEAHNLPGRTRSMISAQIKTDILKKGMTILDDPLHGRQDLAKQALESLHLLYKSLSSLKNSLASESVKPSVTLAHFMGATQDKELQIDYGFQSSRFIPQKLLDLVSFAFNDLRIFLDEQRSFPKRRELLEVWFDLHYWRRVALEFYSSAYITVARLNRDKNVELELFCLDASSYLKQFQGGAFPFIAFSATLTPISYFKTLLSGSGQTKEIPSLVLKTPFDTSRRLQIALTHLSMRYKDRERTLPEIVKAIKQITSVKQGNYLIFSPSFAYQNRLEAYFLAETDLASTDLLFQRQNLTAEGKSAFLARFDNYGEKSLLAFCVMRSLFNEGIDLKGDKLIGVFILGTGMPTISPERTLLEAYYGEKGENGHDYAYTYPGFNQVYQAAGRLIRDEADRGVIVLIDDRYAEESLNQLFPSDWNVKQVQSTKRAVNLCLDFFAENP